MKKEKPIIYNQLDYENELYPYPGNPLQTIARGGCGLCCASMVVENLTDRIFSPQDAGRMAIDCGAHEEPGTNLHTFAPVFAREYDLGLSVTDDAKKAFSFLREGKGLVIANPQGDRPQDGWIGVFSGMVHYIVIAGIHDRTVRVWDPMYEPGRYDIEGRAGKVRVIDGEAYADCDILREDCRGSFFFMFSLQS